MTIHEIGRQAKKASQILASLSSRDKDNALLKIADALIADTDEILKANAVDIENGRQAGLTASLIERLTLTDARIKGMAQGIKDVVALKDPIGEVISGTKRGNGMRIENIRVPLGVVGIIYESRPNVTSDAAALCLKAGNAVILRGGKEAINSNIAVESAIEKGLEAAGLPKTCVQLLHDTSRETANEMMKLREYIDVLIPRGGAGLIRAIVENATIPVIETGVGNCHIYVDEFADRKKIIPIVINAKTQRPSVCNAAETLLINRNIAPLIIDEVIGELDAHHVKIHACDEAVALAKEENKDKLIPATDEDWGTEYLDLEISLKIVGSTDEAIEHINKYSTKHSESIITENYTNAEAFVEKVDSSSVYVNVSTRFTDGAEFGLGAEIGISTQKLHARGPMGLNALTTNKFIIRGEGQIR